MRGKLATKKEQVDQDLLEYIVRLYAQWRQMKAAGCGGREPGISVCSLCDEFGPNNRPRWSYEVAGAFSQRTLYRVILASCKRLQKAGKIESSFGAGRVRREERQYNPVGV